MTPMVPRKALDKVRQQKNFWKRAAEALAEKHGDPIFANARICDRVASAPEQEPADAGHNGRLSRKAAGDTGGVTAEPKALANLELSFMPRDTAQSSAADPRPATIVAADCLATSPTCFWTARSHSRSCLPA